MANNTGMATQYLLNMLKIKGKTDISSETNESSENKEPAEDEQQPPGESVASSTATDMQTESDVSMSVGEVPSYIDGSTPRISLHPVSQTIQLGSNDESGSSVFGNQVEVITRQNHVSSTASNKIKFNQMVKYDWELKNYKGNLIATGGQFIAYTLKGRNGYVVRLLSPQTASRALIKGFVGLVTDLAFSHRDSNTLAGVDEGGNVYVWKIEEEDGKIEYTVKLHVKRSERPTSEYHRIFWCPYLPDDDDDDEKDEDDENRSLAVTHDNQAEVIDVAMIIARCDCNQVTVEMLEDGEGYVSIPDGHTKPITDASLSPDNNVLATGSEDGYVRFWQVAEMMPDSQHPCLHEFQPHGGAPLASLMFCDNQTSHEKDVPMWRFMITGAEYNREIKIWCTVQWTCLQTIRFTSPTMDIENVLGGSYFKMQLDLTARYLVLSDIGRRVLYVLLVHQNREEGQAHISSITDFQLTQSLLSFVISKGKLFQLKSSDELGHENGNSELAEDDYDADSPDELDESEFDSMEKRKNLMVQLRLLSIHTKSLQELLVHLQPEPSVAPPTPTIISSLNTSMGQARDALSDLSGMETGTEASTDLDESDGQVIEPASPLVKPKLITPEAFAQSTKEASRPDSNASNNSSATLVSALNSSQNSVDDMLSSVTSKLSESTKSSNRESPRSLLDANTGILTPTSLPLPGTPPFASAPDPTSVPIPSFGTSPLISQTTHLTQSPVNVSGDVQEESKSDQENHVQEESKLSTPGSTDDCEMASMKKEPFPVMDIPKTPLSEDKTPVRQHEEDMDNTWMTATSDHTPLQLQTIKRLQTEAGLTSSPVSRVDIPPVDVPRPVNQDVSSSLNEILQLMKSQQQQITTLRQEMRTYQSTQNYTQNIREEMTRLENVINDALVQHSASETHRLDKALKERNIADKKKHEQLTSTLSQSVTNSITGKLEKVTKHEMKNSVVPAIQKMITPVQEQLNTTMAQKLTAADAVMKESVNKMLKNKGVVEAIGTSAAVALQGPIQATYCEAFQNTILPAFEKACKSMFQQINDAFQNGTQQYLEKVTATLESQQQQKETQDNSGIEQLKTQIQRNNASMIRDVEAVLQKQLATAMHSLREEMSARFEAQIKTCMQETLKSEVQSALQEMRMTQLQTPVSETTPHQTTVDPKVRITELIRSGNYAMAFQEALTAADLNLVVFVCESVDSNELFSGSNTPLGQPVLLSLIQQLSVDLLNNTDLKHRYLTDAVMALDPSHDVTKEHMPAVLQGLCQQLTYAIQGSQGPLQRQLKVLLMAAQSLLR